MDFKETAARLSQGGIWLPGGTDGSKRFPSEVDEKAAANAVEQYDHSLMLGQRTDTGEWIVFAKRGPEGQPFPVFGLGTRLPHPDDIQKKLYENDVARHGIKLINSIIRKAEAKKKEENYAREQADGIASDQLERVIRDTVKERPQSSIFVPGRGNDLSTA